MAITKPISTTTNIFLPIRNTLLKGVALCAATANSVIEVFDGAIDTVATFVIADGGSSYLVGDLITLVAGEYGGTQAILRVTQIDDNSPSSSISSSPSSSISSSPSASTSPSSSASPSTSPSSSISSSPSTSISSSASSSISSSPSLSESPSTSISSSPSLSASPSTSISSSPSLSASPSTSISSSPSSSISSSISESPSTSISSSPSTSISSSISSSPSTSISSSISTSISSSPSASLSPSVGAGRVTAAEIINAGGGYTAGNTYATTGGSGTGVTITVSTVVDAGTSIMKLAAVPNESAPQFESECGVITDKGISIRISGASAKGHITYE